MAETIEIVLTGDSGLPEAPPPGQVGYKPPVAPGESGQAAQAMKQAAEASQAAADALKDAGRQAGSCAARPDAGAFHPEASRPGMGWQNPGSPGQQQQPKPASPGGSEDEASRRKRLAEQERQQERDRRSQMLLDEQQKKAEARLDRLRLQGFSSRGSMAQKDAGGGPISPEEKKEREEEEKERRDEMLKGMMRGASSFAQKAARGDASAFGDVAQSGAKMAGGAVGGPMGAAAMDALVGAIRGMVDGLGEMNKRFAEVSGVNAQAEAQAELLQTMGDIRRASYAGNELAELRVESAKLSQAAQDALLTIIKPLIEPFTNMMKGITDYLERFSFRGAEAAGFNEELARQQANALSPFGGRPADPASGVPDRRVHLLFPWLFPPQAPLGARR